MHPFYSFSATTIQGAAQPMSHYQGKVVLVVNTASACGFTPQFEGLQQLHHTYTAQGLVILGFPCNQFGQQDKGSNADIASFCQTHYGVDFAMMAKVDVKGPNAHPLFQWLTAQAPGILGTHTIKWNFTKFLIGRDGTVLNRYAPQTAPQKLEQDILAALQATAPQA